MACPVRSGMGGSPGGPAFWAVPRSRDESFIVRDANGQALACVCFEDEPGRRAPASCSAVTAHQMPERDTGRTLESAILPNISWLHVIFAASRFPARAAKDHKSAESAQMKMSQVFL